MARLDQGPTGAMNDKFGCPANPWPGKINGFDSQFQVASCFIEFMKRQKSTIHAYNREHLSSL